MSSVTIAQRMTAEEYLAWEEGPRGAELVGGEVVMPQPRRLHHAVQSEILFRLSAWARAQPGRGEAGLPLDVQLEAGHVYAPDVLWYRAGRVPPRDAPPPYPLPDLAVEVRSPATWRHDIGVKKAVYERHGLPELWLADTAAEEILAFRRSAPATPTFDVALELVRGQTLASPLLPGFALELEGLFEHQGTPVRP